MAQIFNVIEKRWNPVESTWDIIYKATSADLVEDGDSHRTVTITEGDAIFNYLVNPADGGPFNKAEHLVLLDHTGSIPSFLIPSLAYVPMSGNTTPMTGDLDLGGKEIKKVARINGNTTGTDAQKELWLYSSKGVSIRGDELKLKPIDEGLSGIIISGVATPTDYSHAVNLGYLNQRLYTGTRPAYHGPVDAAAPLGADIIDSRGSSPGNVYTTTVKKDTIIDGYKLKVGDRVLLYNQVLGGIFTVEAGQSVRDEEDSVEGVLVFVENGDTHNDWTFYCSNSEEIPATNSRTWAEFTRVDTVKADNTTIEKGGIDGLTFSVKDSGITNAKLAGSIVWSKLIGTTISASKTTWTGGTGMSSLTSIGLKDALENLYSAVKLIRGTATYNENNTQTIADAYTRIDERRIADVGCVAYLISTTNVATRSGSQIVDGIATGTNKKKIVLGGQSTASQNGVWETSTSGWDKITDLVPGGLYYAEEGNANRGLLCRATVDSHPTLELGSAPEIGTLIFSII